MNFKTFVEKARNFLIHKVTVIFSRKILLDVIYTSMKQLRISINKLEIKLTQAQFWWWHSIHSNKMTTTKLPFLLVARRKYTTVESRSIVFEGDGENKR